MYNLRSRSGFVYRASLGRLRAWGHERQYFCAYVVWQTMEYLGIEPLESLGHARARLARSTLTYRLPCIIVGLDLIRLDVQLREDSHLLYEASWVVQSTANLRVGARVILSRK